MLSTLTDLGVGFASAFIPIVNIEAYVGAQTLHAGGVNALWIAFFAAAGQMIGKIGWYFAGKNALRLKWFARRLARPKVQAKLTRWRIASQTYPRLVALMILCSSFVGFPPFAIISVLAGQLHVRLLTFAVVGMVGRFLRLYLIAVGVTLVI